MARIVVIFALWLAACDVGSLPNTADGGTDTNGCVDVSNMPQVGHHSPVMAQGCMAAAACHNQALGLGTGAPAYSYGGVLYKADKTTPYAGGTVIVTLGSAAKKVTASDNGEFYMVPGVAGLDPPTVAMRASTQATACPSIIPMTGTLGAGDGDCQKSGCHTPGVGQGVVYAQ